MGRNARGRASADIADGLHSVAIHLLRRVRQTDAQMGLSSTQASAMSVLVFGGAQTIGELAAAERVAAPTMTRLVKDLESGGYVSRGPDASDGRVVIVRATTKGRRALERGQRLRVAQIEVLLDGLSAAERHQVATAVELLERALGRGRRVD